jgi:hypothetical protein
MYATYQSECIHPLLKINKGTLNLRMQISKNKNIEKWSQYSARPFQQQQGACHCCDGRAEINGGTKN